MRYFGAGKGTMIKNKFIFCTKILLACIVLCSCGNREELLLFSDAEEVQTQEEMQQETAAGENTISVFVCGAVVLPGVVEIPVGSRVVDALEAAGGFAEEADREYVNLAAKVGDGEKIFFPTGAEVQAMERSQAVAGLGLVDINTADSGLLCTLPGIGVSRAEEILRYRELHGTFSCKEDLKKVPCITDNVYAKLQDEIIVYQQGK